MLRFVIEVEATDDECDTGVWWRGRAVVQQGEVISRGYFQTLFSLQQKQHKVSLPEKPPSGDVWRIQELLYWVRGVKPLLFLAWSLLTLVSIRQPPGGEAGVVPEGGNGTTRYLGARQWCRLGTAGPTGVRDSAGRHHPLHFYSTRRITSHRRWWSYFTIYHHYTVNTEYTFFPSLIFCLENRTKHHRSDGCEYFKIRY